VLDESKQVGLGRSVGVRIASERRGYDEVYLAVHRNSGIGESATARMPTSVLQFAAATPMNCLNLNSRVWRDVG
jgi:hypothetical protein